MDWYYGSGLTDSVVPKDEDLPDRLPSPDSWSNWGISVPESFYTPKMFLITDTNPTEVEFTFNDKSYNNELELEYSLHDKDQSSSSSVCGGLPEEYFQQTALSCDHPNYQLQDLLRFEQMDDIFWDLVPEDLPCFENMNKSFYFSPDPQYSNTTPGGLQKDLAASTFVPCCSESNSCLDIEAPPVIVLDPFEETSRDRGMHGQLSVEEFILQDLEMVIAQFTEKTRVCFRDALYRLAGDTKQQHVVQDQNEGCNMQKAMPQMDCNETVRSENNIPMESETNIVDRAVANLMFNMTEISIQDIFSYNISKQSKQY